MDKEQQVPRLTRQVGDGITPVSQKKRFAWWHGLIIFVAANGISALPAGFGGDKAFYNSFVQPWYAPPDWAFAPVWLFLNITSLVALGMVLNGSASQKEKQIFALSEAIGWVLFAAFTLLYFGLKSPILGAIDTVLGLVVGITSLVLITWQSKVAVIFIGLRVLWLLLASAVSISVAISNRDPFFFR